VAFDRIEQRGFFAANITSLPDDYFYVEGEIALKDAFSQKTRSSRLRKGLLKSYESLGILLPQIDVTLWRSDRVSRNGHRLNQAMRIVFEQETVNIGSGISLVCVCNDILFRPFLFGNRAPFLSRRESGAASPSQPRKLDRSHQF
jgi:hypothetical protein